MNVASRNNATTWVSYRLRRLHCSKRSRSSSQIRQASNSSSTARWMINRAPNLASSDIDSRGLSPTHGQQRIDLRFNLRRRRYRTSHGVGLLQLVFTGLEGNLRRRLDGFSYLQRF